MKPGSAVQQLCGGSDDSGRVVGYPEANTDLWTKSRPKYWSKHLSKMKFVPASLQTS